MSSNSATGLRWLPNYAKWFGLAGLPLLLRIMRIDRASDAEPRSVSVPGLGTIWLRGAMRDHAIFQQIWVKREYDLAAVAPRHFAALMDAYRDALAAGQRPLVLDAGGHVGLSVLWWRRLLPEAHIVVVEPSASNLAVLRRNVGNLPHITILHAALAGSTGSFGILDEEQGGSAVRLRADGAGARVPAITVSQIMEMTGADEILLAKVDIEGGEADVFAGDLAWLDRTRALAVETHDWLYPGRGTSRALFAAVAARHMDFLTSGENVLLFRVDQSGDGAMAEPRLASAAWS